MKQNEWYDVHGTHQRLAHQRLDADCGMTPKMKNFWKITVLNICRSYGNVPNKENIHSCNHCYCSEYNRSPKLSKLQWKGSQIQCIWSVRISHKLLLKTLLNRMRLEYSKNANYQCLHSAAAANLKSHLW